MSILPHLDKWLKDSGSHRRGYESWLNSIHIGSRSTFCRRSGYYGNLSVGFFCVDDPVEFN